MLKDVFYCGGNDGKLRMRSQYSAEYHENVTESNQIHFFYDSTIHVGLSNI